MSTSSAAALLADSAPSQADGNSNAPAPTSAAPPVSAPPAASPPASSDWVSSIGDEDLRGYVQNKGWSDPVELANGYRNLEKLLGGEKLPLPKGDDDAEGWTRVYEALGRPKTAADYNLDPPENGDTTFLGEASNWMHEAGLSQRQATLMAQKWNEYVETTQRGIEERSAAESQRQLDSLKSEWGGAWDENFELAKRATRQFGLNQAALEGLENSIGAGEMYKLLSRIGRGLTEHTFESGKTTQGFGMTPEAARTRLNMLRNDPEWSAKYMNGNEDARNEMARLMSVAYPE